MRKLSAISSERCPSCRRNAVRHHSGITVRQTWCARGIACRARTSQPHLFNGQGKSSSKDPSAVRIARTAINLISPVAISRISDLIKRSMPIACVPSKSATSGSPPAFTRYCRSRRWPRGLQSPVIVDQGLPVLVLGHALRFAELPVIPLRNNLLIHGADPFGVAFRRKPQQRFRCAISDNGATLVANGP
jgi:hypothetical protein